MIDGRYEPVEILGTGGMATVWKARDTVLDRWVAVKRLLPHLASDSGISGRFEREAQASARLNHPGIVTIHDTGFDEEGAFIVLEFVEGETLGGLLARVGTLDLATAVGVVEQVGAALDYAHDHGVVHRDVKPANLIMATDGAVKLADFGIARSIDDPSTLTQPGDVVGTLAYMAPEVIEGGEITASSDIYSLAAVTHEMLSGHPPFEAESVGNLLDKIRSGDSLPIQAAPEEVSTSIAVAMSVDPEQRPATAGAFATSLVASTTLLLDPYAIEAVGAMSPAAAAGEVASETLVLSPGAVPRAATAFWRKAPLAASLVVAALLAAAYAVVSNQVEGVASPDTTPRTTTTTAVTTTTTTTTTVPTTIAVTPFTIADEIRSHLAELSPPEFKPPDVNKVSERLDQLMDAWAKGEPKLEKKQAELLDSVQKLPESPQREHLEEHVSELADAIGIETNDDDDH